MNLYFVRHGQTDWNTERRMQGCRDIPLNEKGRAQAKACGESLRDTHFDAVYCSPLSRAYDTCMAIVGEREVEVVTDDRLREFNYGIWEGKYFEEAMQDNPELWYIHWVKPGEFAIPEGDSAVGKLAEAESFFEELLPKHEGQNVLLVSHGYTCQFIIAAALNLHLNDVQYFYQDNASVSLIQIANERRFLRLFNDTCHLKGI